MENIHIIHFEREVHLRADIDGSPASFVARIKDPVYHGSESMSSSAIGISGKPMPSVGDKQNHQKENDALTCNSFRVNSPEGSELLVTVGAEISEAK